MWRRGAYGAGGQTRTGTRFPSPDFKSGMATNSITPACATLGDQVAEVYSLQTDLKVARGNGFTSDNHFSKINRINRGRRRPTLEAGAAKPPSSMCPSTTASRAQPKPISRGPDESVSVRREAQDIP